jgi:hypothetical protein
MREELKRLLIEGVLIGDDVAERRVGDHNAKSVVIWTPRKKS